MSSKLVTVYGATGAQGSSVAYSLLDNKSSTFNVRAISRNPNSDAAQALATAGAEVVQANGFDKDQMIAAFRGSWGVFVNTNSDDPSFVSPADAAAPNDESLSETQLGRIIVDAAAEAGVKHFVYSGMASVKDTTGGAISVLGFEEKYAIGKYAQTKGFETVNLVSPGFYMENYTVADIAAVFGGFPLIPSEDGELVLRAPKFGGKENIPFIAIKDDYGDLVHGVFLDPVAYNGTLVHGISELQSQGNLVGSFEKVTGKKARFDPLASWEDLETYGVKALETVKLIYKFCQHTDGKYFGVQSDKSTPTKLKAAAAVARGRSGAEAELTTAETFFRRAFA